MKIIKHGFSILKENEITYFNHLHGIVESCDELSTIEITKTPDSISFRIVCSLPKYSQTVLQKLLEFHNLLNIRLNLSKSIKNNSIIHYEIEL